MNNFNEVLFNSSVSSSSAQPSFPELYIRNFLNDLGETPLELTPLAFTVEIFTAILSQVDFTLSHIPTQLFSPTVYLNGSPLYKDKNYTINAQTISIPVLTVGDIITVRYVY